MKRKKGPHLVFQATRQRFLNSIQVLIIFGTGLAFAAEGGLFPPKCSEPPVPTPRRVTASDLPKEVREQFGNLETNDTVQIFELDLNGDGEKELFVVTDPVSGPEGGLPANQLLFIFAPASRAWRNLATIPADFYLAAPLNGWSQIVTKGPPSLPGHRFVRVLWTFDEAKGRYWGVGGAVCELTPEGKERVISELAPIGSGS